LIGLGVIRLFSKGNSLLWPLTGFAIVCGSLSLLSHDHAWLKLYPVGMSLGALIIFALTLIKPPSMIERFARLVEPDLPASGVQWTRQVTTQVWVIYNGFISDVLMGILFLGEFILRKRHQRLHSSNH
ncbi:Clp protease, partial [Acinetobacter baumannii]